MSRWSPVKQLFLARLREFYREPEALFWVYGFPLLLAVGLGIAFMRREPKPLDVDLVSEDPPTAETKYLGERLEAEGMKIHYFDLPKSAQRYRTGRTALYVEPTAQGYRYHYDPAREESLLARYQAENVILQLRGHIELEDPGSGTPEGAAHPTTRHWAAVGDTKWQTSEAYALEPGSRYIDFLIPGLMGMNLMGGGMWGVGFVLVDMRMRKLLKRLLATPMRRGDFLLVLLGSRLLFLVPDMLILTLVGYFLVGVPIRGDLGSLLLVILLGGATFAGIGLLVASRTEKIETVSGLMQAVMLPMWVMSGIFFSSKRFPDVMQPFIQALPLTQVNDALREVMLEGAGVMEISWRLAILAVWTAVSFLLALKWFRWN